MKRLLSLICLIPLIAAATSSDDTAALGRHLNHLKNFAAKFEQMTTDGQGNVVQRATGQVYLKSPGRFRWRTQTPYEQLIVSDSKNLWVYDIELEQVSVQALEANVANTPGILLTQPFNQWVKQYHVALKDKSGSGQLFELRPKDSENSGFSALELGFEKEILTNMVIVDKLGQRTLLRFNEAKMNSRLDNQLFAFVPPKDVDVIGEPIR